MTMQKSKKPTLVEPSVSQFAIQMSEDEAGKDDSGKCCMIHFKIKTGVSLKMGFSEESPEVKDLLSVGGDQNSRWGHLRVKVH